MNFAHAALLMVDAAAAAARLAAAARERPHVLSRRELDLAGAVLEEGRLLVIAANKLDALDTSARQGVVMALQEQARLHDISDAWTGIRGMRTSCLLHALCGPTGALLQCKRAKAGVLTRNDARCLQINTSLASWQDCITVKPLTGATGRGAREILQHLVDTVPRWSRFVPAHQLAAWRYKMAAALQGARPSCGVALCQAHPCLLYAPMVIEGYHIEGHAWGRRSTVAESAEYQGCKARRVVQARARARLHRSSSSSRWPQAHPLSWRSGGRRQPARRIRRRWRARCGRRLAWTACLCACCLSAKSAGRTLRPARRAEQHRVRSVAQEARVGLARSPPWSELCLW